VYVWHIGVQDRLVCDELATFVKCELTLATEFDAICPFLDRSSIFELDELQMAPSLTSASSFASIVKCHQLARSTRVSGRGDHHEIGEGELMRCWRQ